MVSAELVEYFNSLPNPLDQVTAKALQRIVNVEESSPQVFKFTITGESF
jgi:hypothetical protein